MKNSLESLSLFEFMCHSKSENDFYTRISQMCGVISLEFKIRVQDEVKFDFHLVKIIDEINSDVQSLVKSINSITIIESQPKVPNNLFIEIIKIHYTDLYNDYYYYKKIIAN